MACVSYLRPGFELSKFVADLAGARAIVLAHHGLVTWGETHEESYDLTLDLVPRAGASVEKRGGDLAVEPRRASSEADEDVLARLRGRLARAQRRVLVVD